jgi:tetratricopeptide (TPR) repeat protein
VGAKDGDSGPPEHHWSSPVPRPQPRLPARRWSPGSSEPPKRGGSIRRLLTLGTGPASLTGWALALLLGVAVAVFGRGEAGPPLDAAPDDSTRIAVFPFTYQGTEQYRYLGPGIAELLNIGLGELYPLRMVNPQALAAALEIRFGEGGLGEEGGRLAQRFGANFFITGSVIEIGGRLEVIAYLYDRRGELLATLREHASGESEVFRVVDDLVRGLVALGHLPAASALGRTAAMTTHSFPALRSFLKGEEHYRNGDYTRALESMEKAVSLDPSFALAYYRGALSTLWEGSSDFDLAREWIEGAAAHAYRLPEQERLLIQALGAFVGGVPREGERLYRQLLAMQPENAEAWFNLGELLFHYGPIMGRDPFESREAWERVLEVEPQHSAALFHLGLTAAGEGRIGALSRILDRIAGIDAPRGPSLSLEALAAWAHGDGEARARALARARHEPGRGVHWAAEYLVRYLQDVPAALEMAQVLVETARTPDEMAEAHLRIAFLQLARGRIASAEEALDAAAAVDPVLAEMVRGYLASLPSTVVELRALAAAAPVHPGEDPPGVLAARDATPRVGSARLEAVPPFPGTGGGLRPSPPLTDVAWYLVGLHAVTGKGLASTITQPSEAIARLEALGGDGEGAWPLSRSLAGALRAELDLRSQRRTEARERLEAALADARMWYEGTRVSPLYSMARERFLLAGLLRDEARTEEAATLYRSLVRSTLGEAPLLGPSWIRLAELHEAAGDPESAVALYRRILELWRDADPELEEVRAELLARVESQGRMLVRSDAPLRIEEYDAGTPEGPLPFRGLIR